ncbi:MAG: CHRD domain-containing protein [Massilia sp.]
MKHVLSILALATASLVTVSAAQAQANTPGPGGGGGTSTISRATLSGPSEMPPNPSPGYSVSTVEISGTTLRVEVPFKELLGITTASHIHCCTGTAFTGVAPIALPFTDFPLGVRSGTYSHAFDLTNEMTFEPAFLTAHGGSASGASSALLSGIAANEAYVNIHTNRFPNGEIRGFIVAAPIPEPASWAMLGMGLAGLGFMARRKV